MTIADEAEAAAFLHARLGDGVRGVTPIGQGEWSKAYVFRHADQEYVVRFSALLEDFAKDQRAVRFSSDALPVPRVVALGEAPAGYYCISERLPGAYLDDADGHHLRRLLPSLFAALDAARRADLSGTTGYGIWGIDGNAPFPSWPAALLDVASDRPTDRIAGWRARLAVCPTGDAPFDAAYRQLARLAPDLPNVRHLVHSDLLHDNVLVASERITAVLDWGCSLYGDFLYDLAWLCFWAPWFPAWRGIDFAAEARRHYAAIGLEVPAFEVRLQACQIHIGLAGVAYMAYRGYLADLEPTMRRTLEVAGLRA